MATSLRISSCCSVSAKFIGLGILLPVVACVRGVMMRAVAVKELYAIQNGFMGAQRSLLFYGEYSGDRVQIPVTCWLVKTTDGTILFDTGLSPRAVPGLMRNDPLARFTEEDLLVHRLDTLGLQAADVDLAGDACYWQEHIDGERPPGVVWNPTQAMHSIKRLKTLARLTGGRIFPSHDPEFWRTIKQAPDAIR